MLGIKKIENKNIFFIGAFNKQKKMSKKMLKEDYVKVITEHFNKEGKKLTNLKKAKINDMINIIKEYNIIYDENDIINNRLMKAKEQKEEKIKEQKEKEEKDILYKEELLRNKKFWDSLNDIEKDNVITYCVIEKQKQYLNNYWKYKKHNEKLKEFVIKRVQQFIDDGFNVEIINDNSYKVNGVVVIEDFLYNFDYNDTYNRIKEDYINSYQYAEPILNIIKEKENEKIVL